jgi:uncharacterized membrane protein
VPFPYYLSVSVHVFAALLWLGGMFFLAVVGAPVIRELDSRTLRARLFQVLGARFRTVGWICIVVLVITGFTNLHFRGLLEAELLADPGFWSSPYGTALTWKLGGVTAMILTSALHDFWLGPAAKDAGRGSPRAERMRKVSSWVARVNAGLGVVVVLAAIRLARGG